MAAGIQIPGASSILCASSGMICWLQNISVFCARKKCTLLGFVVVESFRWVYPDVVPKIAAEGSPKKVFDTMKQILRSERDPRTQKVGYGIATIKGALFLPQPTGSTGGISGE